MSRLLERLYASLGNLASEIEVHLGCWKFVIVCIKTEGIDTGILWLPMPATPVLTMMP
jgi:hypothetical protein